MVVVVAAAVAVGEDAILRGHNTEVHSNANGTYKNCARGEHERF